VPPPVDPLASLPAGNIQKFDLVLGTLVSQNTKTSISLIEKGRAMAALNPSSVADLDLKPLIDGLASTLSRSFSRIVRVDDLAQAKNVGADLVGIIDIYGKPGQYSGQTTRIDLKVIFTTTEGTPVETISGVGEARVPYPAFNIGFQAAANKALADFSNAFSNSTGLTAFAKAQRRTPPSTSAEAAATPSIAGSPKAPEERKWRSAGSGFLLRGTSYILTNLHVVQAAAEVRISFPSGEVYPGTVVGRDSNNDLALVLLQGMRPKTGGFVPSLEPEVEPGEQVHALGYPLGTQLSRQPSIVSGQVSAKTGLEDNIAQFRMTAPINEGNSGGPVVNSQGTLVGIATSGLVQRGVEAIRFATKISVAALVLGQVQLAREFTIEVVPSKKTITPQEIFQTYSPFVALVETR
jgi:S1-C subfamily serine protease